MENLTANYQSDKCLGLYKNSDPRVWSHLLNVYNHCFQTPPKPLSEFGFKFNIEQPIGGTVSKWSRIHDQDDCHEYSRNVR